jgi:uncharacterized protein
MTACGGPSAPESSPKPYAYGTYEDAQSWIGYTQEIEFGVVPVNEGMIKTFAALLEDGNPSYWDEDIAGRIWGGLISPPAMLHVWLMPLNWTPKPSPTTRVSSLSILVPLPGDTIINSSTDTRYFRPIRAGDRLNFVEQVTAVSPQKKTRLGTGHFVTTVGTYRTQAGKLVAVHTNVAVRYRSGN